MNEIFLTISYANYQSIIMYDRWKFIFYELLCRIFFHLSRYNTKKKKCFSNILHDKLFKHRVATGDYFYNLFKLLILKYNFSSISFLYILAKFMWNSFVLKKWCEIELWKPCSICSAWCLKNYVTQVLLCYWGWS